MSSLPIGLFDSGVGGLTVMREVAALLPHEDLIYFGDTARLPYGNKSPEAVIRFSLENAHFLVEQKIKLLLVCCHTASAHAIDLLESSLPIPVIGMKVTGVQALLAATQSKRVAVLGTTSTISSGVFQSSIKSFDPSIHVSAIACPLFVPFVEEGFQDHTAARLIAEHYLSPLQNSAIDAVLLACTHYPLLKTIIRDILGPKVALIEPARNSALAAFELLRKTNLFNPSTTVPTYRFYVSDDPDKFHEQAKIFFSHPIGKVQLVKNKIL